MTGISTKFVSLNTPIAMGQMADKITRSDDKEVENRSNLLEETVHKNYAYRIN